MSVKKISVDFPEDLYKSVKVFSAVNDFSIKKFVIDAVREKLSQTKFDENELNDEVKSIIKKGLKDKKQGKLHQYDNFQAIMKEIDNEDKK